MEGSSLWNRYWARFKHSWNSCLIHPCLCSHIFVKPTSVSLYHIDSLCAQKLLICNVKFFGFDVIHCVLWTFVRKSFVPYIYCISRRHIHPPFPFPAMMRLCNVSRGFPSMHGKPPHTHSFSLCFDPLMVGGVTGFEWKGGADGVMGTGFPRRHGDRAGRRQTDVNKLFTCDWRETLLWGGGNIPHTLTVCPHTHTLFSFISLLMWQTVSCSN